MNLNVTVNEPFDPALIKHLYSDREDTKLSSPFTKFPFDESEWIQMFKAHPENCSLVFDIDAQVMGHTSFLPKEEELFLCYVMLDPKFRKTGIAAEMIKLSEEFARLNYPHQELYLHVNIGNDRAKKLYENLGYSVCAELDSKFKMKKLLRF